MNNIFKIILLLTVQVTQVCYALELYAHRAGRGLAPEHSLIAIKKSIDLGVDVIDIDVVLSF